MGGDIQRAKGHAILASIQPQRAGDDYRGAVQTEMTHRQLLSAIAATLLPHLEEVAAEARRRHPDAPIVMFHFDERYSLPEVAMGVRAVFEDAEDLELIVTVGRIKSEVPAAMLEVAWSSGQTKYSWREWDSYDDWPIASIATAHEFLIDLPTASKVFLEALDEGLERNPG